MFALEAKGKAIEGRSGSGDVAQGPGEIRRLSGDPRRRIQFEIDHDNVAFGDPAPDTIRGADPDEVLPAHQRDPAPPRMAVDRDGDRGPSAGMERLHDTLRNLDASRVARRNDSRHELHVYVLGLPSSDANRPRRYFLTASSVVRPMATVSAWAAEVVSPTSDKRWPHAAQ